MAKIARYSASDLRERVTLQQSVSTSNAAHEVTEAWADEVINIPAMVRYEKGPEKMRAGRYDQTVGALVVMYHREDVTAEKRLTHRGRVLRIHSAVDPDERGAWLELVCSADG